MLVNRPMSAARSPVAAPLIEVIVSRCASKSALAIPLGRNEYHTMNATVMPTNSHIMLLSAFPCSLSSHDSPYPSRSFSSSTCVS